MGGRGSYAGPSVSSGTDWHGGSCAGGIAGGEGGWG